MASFLQCNYIHIIDTNFAAEGGTLKLTIEDAVLTGMKIVFN